MFGQIKGLDAILVLVLISLHTIIYKMSVLYLIFSAQEIEKTLGPFILEY